MKLYRIVLIMSGLLWVAGPPLWAQEGYPAQGRLLDDLFVLKSTKTARLSSYDKSGANHDYVAVAPGETKTLAEISGAGVIRRFYLLAWSVPDRMRYRKLILRMYWDGEKDPSVEVPLGDFFGSGLGTLRYFHSVVVDINTGIPRLGILTAW